MLGVAGLGLGCHFIILFHHYTLTQTHKKLETVTGYVLEELEVYHQSRGMERGRLDSEHHTREHSSGAAPRTRC